MVDPSLKQKIAEKQAILIEMVNNFFEEKLNTEYNHLCKKLIQKMSRKRNVPFITGRLDIWAGSIISAIGQINFLFDRSNVPHCSATDISNFFGINKSTTSQKAKIIRDMFKLRYWHPEFSTEKMLMDNPFSRLGIIYNNGKIIFI
ncbi:MAG: DUF6398 domain-containing protein [Promethearchaeota archaeon]